MGPVKRTVALGLDDGFLGRPGDDVRHEIIGVDELFFMVIEVFVAHAQHLLAVLRLSIKPDDLLPVNSQSDQPLRVGDADVHLLALDHRCPLLIVRKCRRVPGGETQQQSFHSLLALPLDRHVHQVLTGHARFTAQGQQLRRLLIESPHQHSRATAICHLVNHDGN